MTLTMYLEYLIVDLEHGSKVPGVKVVEEHVDDSCGLARPRRDLVRRHGVQRLLGHEPR